MDIKKEVAKAISQNILWSKNEFYDVIDILKYNNVEVSFWEGEENWATLIINAQVIGYLWQKFPIIFIIEEYFDIIYKDLQHENYLSIIKVESLITTKLKLNEVLLNAVFGVQFDDCNFSVDDLWFYTNS